MRRPKIVSFAIALTLSAAALTVGMSATFVVGVLWRIVQRALDATAAPKDAGERFAASDLPPTNPNPYWNQPLWALDPSNTTGCASDSNNCSQTTCGAGGSNQGPCVTWRQIVQRWGTNSPQHNKGNDIDFELIGSQPDNSDPIIYYPQQIPGDAGATTGNTVLFHCVKTLATTTTISTLTAKVPSTNTQLAVTFGTAPTRGQQIVNTTRAGSIAWIGRSNAPSHLTQPCSPSSSLGTGAPIQPCNENNAWAIGDTIQLYNLPAWTFAEVKPVQVGMAGETVVIAIDCFDQEFAPAGVGPGDDRTVVGNGVQFVQSFVERSYVVDQAFTQYTGNSSLVNSSLVGGFYGGQLAQTVPNSAERSSPYLITAGLVASQNTTGIGSMAFTNVALIRGVMLRSGGGTGFPILMQGYNYFGEVQLADATTILQVVGVADGQNTAAALEAGELWGLGKLDADPGRVYYAIATGAAATLPVATLEMMGGTNTCCATIANPSVVNCSLTLSAAALAAGACSTVGPALGNAAFLPWGGSYVGF